MYLLICIIISIVFNNKNNNMAKTMLNYRNSACYIIYSVVTVLFVVDGFEAFPIMALYMSWPAVKKHQRL